MKRLYTLILLTGIWSVSLAQQGGQAVTLEQAIQYALDNSINIKNSVIDEKIADARVKETRGIGLPQVDGSVQLLHNQKLPRFFATYETAQNFAGEDELGNPNLDIPGVAPSDVVAMQQFFQLPSSGTAGVTINQILFNSSYLVGLKAANAYRELSVRTTRQTKEQTIQNVTKAYYACLINKDRMQLFDANIGRVDTLLRTTRALNQNGFAEGIDVDRIQVTLNNLKVERDKFYNLQELSTQLLKFQMNYPMDQPLEVVGELSQLQVDENVLNNYTTNWDYSERVDFQLLESNKRLLALDIKNKFSTSIPSLSVFANLGYSTQSPNISGIFKTNTNISDNGMLGPDKWYSTSSFGLSLNVPLFSGLQRTYRLQQAKLALLKVENNSTLLKSSIDLEIKQAAINYLNAVKTLKSQEENRGLAQNIARITKIKYEQGVGSNIEVIDAESSLKEAQVNYYSALYDALVSKVDLDKAYGKLSPTTQPK
jgi:outer membrane protein TolC